MRIEERHSSQIEHDLGRLPADRGQDLVLESGCASDVEHACRSYERGPVDGGYDYVELRLLHVSPPQDSLDTLPAPAER